MREAYGRRYQRRQLPAQLSLDRPTVEEPKGAVYIGPCKCGSGPDAHYRLSDGRIVHASSVPSAQPVSSEDATSEFRRIKSENEELRKRMKELEQRLGKQ